MPLAMSLMGWSSSAAWSPTKCDYHLRIGSVTGVVGPGIISCPIVLAVPVEFPDVTSIDAFVDMVMEGILGSLSGPVAE